MLDGVRVLEFGQHIAGPLTGMMLADLGAEVIKIERPGGDPARGLPAYEIWNRNKRVAELDLAEEEGAARARQLATAADVVIDGLKSGTLSRFGLSGEALLALSPRLVVGALPAYPRHVPIGSSSGWEPIIAAQSGVFAAEDPDNPVFTSVPFNSAFAALVAADCITAALVERNRTGLGQLVEVSLYGAYFEAMGINVLKIDGAPLSTKRARESPWCSDYRCADDRWLGVSAQYEPERVRLATAVGRQDWIDRGLTTNAAALGEDPSRGKEIAAELAEMLSTKPAEEWEELLGHTVGLTVCRSVEEWLEDPVAAASGHVVEAPTALGPMRQPGRIVTNPDLRSRSLEPVSYVDAGSTTWTAPATMRQQATNGVELPTRPPLDGLRVLDISIALAAPSCARILGELGADVIRIEHAHRQTHDFTLLDSSRGKRSVKLDLKAPQGTEVLLKLIDQSDVIIQNFRTGVSESLGFGYEEVSKRQPRIVYLSVTAFGVPGPFAGRRGYDREGAAATGMTLRGQEGNAPPYRRLTPVGDYGSGLAGALAVLAALYERDETGRGSHVRASLSATYGIHQSISMLSYRGVLRKKADGPARPGWSAASRMYRAADRWLYVHCPDQDAWHRLATIPEFDSLSPLPFPEEDGPTAERLEAIFATRRASEWIALLEAAGVPSAPIWSVGELGESDVAFAADFMRRTPSAIGVVDHLGIPYTFSRSQVGVDKPAPVSGADGKAVLADCGYSPAEVAAMVESGIVRLPS